MMEVTTKGKDGLYSKTKLGIGDFFLVDTAFVDDEIMLFVVERGASSPLVVEEIDEERGSVKPKFLDRYIDKSFIIKVEK
jgi:hypothetical protein